MGGPKPGPLDPNLYKIIPKWYHFIVPAEIEELA
jgi:hypothetical protein